MKTLLYKIGAVLFAYGPWGILLLSVIDSVGVPLPAAMDFLLIGLAAGSVKAPQHAYFAALMAVVGSVGGNVALFLAARRGARWLRKSEPPAGKRRRFREWFARYGLLTVFVPAVTPAPPLPLKVFVISAGALRTPFYKFLLVVALARAIRFFGEAWLGLALGQDAQGFLMRHGWALTGLVAGLAIALYLLIWWRESRHEPAL